MQRLIDNIVSEFNSRFDNEPTLVKSPGRVNLIGEHTDYNNGFVLPAAIDKVIVLAMAANGLNKCRLYSMDMNESTEVELSMDLNKHELHWVNYILGSADQLLKNGYEVEGFDCVFGGNIPIGAGLSSSAALEGGIIYGLSNLFDLAVSKLDMAKMGQKAENEFVGMQCGIMDQFANIYGKKGHVLKLDCRSLEYETYPFRRPDIKIILCDTGVHRELASSEYNIRRQQCEEGVRTLQNHDTSIQSLRDVNLDTLKKYRGEFNPVVFQRCQFVLEENERVEASCESLVKDDFEAFGKKMYESHYGLRDIYEVSCKELDTLVEIAESTDGVYGARMMGGGFGGCTINLVEDSQMESFKEKITDGYFERTGKKLKIYQTKISGGTHLVETSERSVEKI